MLLRHVTHVRFTPTVTDFDKVISYIVRYRKSNVVPVGPLVNNALVPTLLLCQSLKTIFLRDFLVNHD